jgi:hypothetical protein
MRRRATPEVVHLVTGSASLGWTGDAKLTLPRRIVVRRSERKYMMDVMVRTDGSMVVRQTAEKIGFAWGGDDVDVDGCERGFVG